jgi:hypothetical protein
MAAWPAAATASSTPASAAPRVAQHAPAPQALALRLAPEDAAALRFLIESLNDDGYLEDSLEELAATLVDDDDELDALDSWCTASPGAQAAAVLEPAGVGARDLAECLCCSCAPGAPPATRRAAPSHGAGAAGPRRALDCWPGATCAWRRPAVARSAVRAALA